MANENTYPCDRYFFCREKIVGSYRSFPWLPAATRVKNKYLTSSGIFDIIDISTKGMVKPMTDLEIIGNRYSMYRQLIGAYMRMYDVSMGDAIKDMRNELQHMKKFGEEKAILAQVTK